MLSAPARGLLAAVSRARRAEQARTSGGVSPIRSYRACAGFAPLGEAGRQQAIASPLLELAGHADGPRQAGHGEGTDDAEALEHAPLGHAEAVAGESIIRGSHERSEHGSHQPNDGVELIVLGHGKWNLKCYRDT